MKKIFISILLMLTTNLLALENEKSISKEQQEFFEKEIVSQLKTHGDCKVYNICDGEKKADILFKLKDVILVPNSNKIYFITYATNSHSCFACSVATNIFLYEKIDNKMKLISKDLKADVYSTFGEAPNFKLIEVGKNNYSLSYISSQGHGGIENYLTIFSMDKNKLKKIASILIEYMRDSVMPYDEIQTKYSFVKSDKKFYDIKLDVTKLKDSKVVKTYKEIYTYKNGKYSLNK
ncbi:hypothetical protein NG767_09775 [Aliarcobacter cryaerophilus]|uniref:hypothetical protein n=1 Tax=Aliarcobacter cryaerophilus TaxID=28198 RepID=UPI003DA2EACC